jgi:hypothetical protein
MIGVVVIAGCLGASAEAQSRRADPFQSRRFFTRLFDAGRRLPPSPSRPSTGRLRRGFGAQAFRERPVAPECETCSSRAGVAHVVLDSPLLTDEWLAHHTYQANGGQYGDNRMVADFWFDAVHRRIMTRSLVLQEVDDPADLRLGRAAGRSPNSPDLNATLETGTTVGHVGFVQWGSNGFTSYFAAMQGAVRNEGTGYLDLATATGEPGRTRSGSTYSPEDLIKHVRLHPSGELEVGFDTNPDRKPETSLLVRGNVHVEGTLTVDAVPPPRSFTCEARTATGTGRTASATCDPNQVATGGGGTCASGEMIGSRPLLSQNRPSGWEVACSHTRSGQHAAWVICCAQ